MCYVKIHKKKLNDQAQREEQAGETLPKTS